MPLLFATPVAQRARRWRRGASNGRSVRGIRSLFWVLLALVLSLTGPTPHSAWASTSAAPAVGPGLGRAPAEFSRLDFGWLSIEYHPSLAVPARRMAEVGSDFRQELQTLLSKPVLGRVTVRLGRTPGEMELLAPPGARLPRYASGVAFSEQALVLLTATSRNPGDRHDLAEVFRHELAHVALHEAVGRDRVPRWFNEGFAVHTSGEAETARIQALWTATVAETLIPLEQLRQRFPEHDHEASIAYAESADLVRYLLKGDERHRFSDLLERLERGQAFEAALADAYGASLFVIERDWKRDLAKRYTFWPVLFGGSLVWVLGLGLLIAGYVKRRKRAQQKLLTWAREEAAEDARRELALAVLRQAGPVRVVLAPVATSSDATSVPEPARTGGAQPVAPAGGEGSISPEPRLPLRITVNVPKVEHDGGWHTLH